MQTFTCSATSAVSALTWLLSFWRGLDADRYNSSGTRGQMDYYCFALEHVNIVGQGLDKPGINESWIRSGLSGSEVSRFGLVASSVLQLLLVSLLLLMLLLMLLCDCNSSLFGLSGAPCRQNTLLPPGSTSFLGTREVRHRWLQSQDSDQITKMSFKGA